MNGTIVRIIKGKIYKISSSSFLNKLLQIVHNITAFCVIDVRWRCGHSSATNTVCRRRLSDVERLRRVRHTCCFHGRPSVLSVESRDAFKFYFIYLKKIGHRQPQTWERSSKLEKPEKTNSIISPKKQVSTPRRLLRTCWRGRRLSFVANWLTS